jgi:hypothetical protein
MSDVTRTPNRGPIVPVLFGLAGLFIGAAIASGIFWILMLRQQARHDAQLVAVMAPLNNAGDIVRSGVPMFDMRESDESKVQKSGTEFVEDLENNRLPSAYRSMTPAFQMKTDRQAFDTRIAEYPMVRNLLYGDRTTKVKRGADGQSYEYYMTATERNADSSKNKVNFFLSIVRVNDEWRVAEFEIIADSKPAKK